MSRAMCEMTGSGAFNMVHQASNLSPDLWGGTLSLKPNGSVMFNEALAYPIAALRGIWKGGASFRRPAQIVREIEANAFNFIFVEGGELAIGTSSGELTVGHNELVIVRGSHGYFAQFRPSDVNGLRATNIIVPEHLLVPHLVGEVGSGQIFSTCEGHGLAVSRLADLLIEVAPEMNGSLRASLVELYIKVAAECLSSGQRDITPRKLSDQRYQDIISYIQNNIHRHDLSAELVAKQCRVSLRYLSMLLSRHGSHLPDLIRRMRIDMAKSMLLSDCMNSYTVSDVASMLGFKNISHFSKTFKILVGDTPRRFRNNGGM